MTAAEAAKVIVQLLWSFLKIGLFSFGGGYAMISLIAREIVEHHHWLDTGELLDVIAVSESTPGPVGINAATYVGFKVGGILGSAVATSASILAPFCIVFLLGYLFEKYGQLRHVKQAVSGLRPVLVALIVSSAYTLGSSTLTGFLPVLVACAVSAGIVFMDVDPVLLLAASGVLGLILYR